MSCPEALRSLPLEQLPAAAAEIRDFLVEHVCRTGGHLGPNLGAVELTLALHRVFTSPRDALVFDIGHQGYVHKLLTGRGEGFARLRQAGGLSGYLSRTESDHDLVENSHASTALSYADGLAKARQLSGQSENRAVVAVIGDGALTGGLAWEALNNLGAARRRPVIVVVNDNGRSYAPTTGALAAHLDVLKQDGGAHACQNLFTELGFTYFGPVDGHSIGDLEEVLRRARSMQRPVVVHVATVKGKGYRPAETDAADCLHAVGTLDHATGAPAATPGPAAATGASAPSWTSVFGQALADLAGERADLVAVTASMLRPTGLHTMAGRFPDRVFDVGIAEQHAVTSAAGLAMDGFHPVVAIYATFLNRAFDQVLMDVALHKLPVTFVLDRAGVTGPDGPSHHGMWDLSVLSAVPGLRIAAPRDAARLPELLRDAAESAGGPTVLRIPKGPAAADVEAVARMDGLDILHRSPGHRLDVLLVPVGPLAAPALQAARALERQDVGTTVMDPRWVLPVEEALPALAARHRLAVTVEDGLRTGGVGAALAQACREAAVATPVLPLGLPHAFLPHGSREALLAEAGLDPHGILHAIRRALAQQPGTSPALPVPVTTANARRMR
ncbi:1-deoxy-D-xylulose-5-phosphate synthase [Streptomyces nondiastaticus]|uniref:1-deoxy-D-xylulose-5-phosphate synthase n=1 Tax=Streptomyces nondiastaticus TaxID=3154512 RepID=UPI003F4DE0D9